MGGALQSRVPADVLQIPGAPAQIGVPFEVFDACGVIDKLVAADKR
jgi:hypothetical protein